MKILHLCDHYRPLGGAEKLLFDTLESIEEDGKNSNIVVTHNYPENKYTGIRKEYIVDNLDIQPYSNDFISYFANSISAKNKLHKIIEYEKPDVIHIHNIQNPFIIYEAIKNSPVVRTIHDPRLYCFTEWRLLPNRDVCPYPLGYKCLTQGCLWKELIRFTRFGKSAIPKYVSYLLHRKVDKLLLISKAMIACALQNKYSQKQIAYLPNFTTVEPIEKVLERNKRLSNPKENTIVFVGRASYEKGIDFLLEAVSLIKTPFKLYLITGGPYMEEIYSNIKRLKLEDKVSITGVLSYEKIREYYSASDVVVVPSVWIEPFCLVGIEAMANAKPVVAFRTGGISDWLIDGKTGFLAEPKDSKDLAKKIEIVLSDKKTASRYGLNAYEYVKKNYNKEQYILKLLSVYETVIQSRKSKS